MPLWSIRFSVGYSLLRRESYEDTEARFLCIYYLSNMTIYEINHLDLFVFELNKLYDIMETPDKNDFNVLL